MAVNRVLSNIEREIMKVDTNFQREVIYSLKNFASYWAITSDAATKVALPNIGYERWAKNWIYSSRLLANLDIIENDVAGVVADFIILLKGMNLWDSAISTFSGDTVVTYMMANAKFDELAQAYITFKTPTALGF